MIVVLSQGLALEFEIFSDEISRLWLERMSARHHWPLDDPGRFYGFGTPDQQRIQAENRLQEDISTINRHDNIISRPWTNIWDQDLLNYLHNVFEKYHGLLDQQDTAWWNSAPDSVRKAMARLNIDVHRAESVARSPGPRFVCTWYGQPKEKQLTQDQISRYGQLDTHWGGVYLNYVEIGKTLEDLSRDDDQYISDDAFRPFVHYSSDFSVRFYDRRADTNRIAKYFSQHREFFQKHSIDSPDHPWARPNRFKVGQLKYTGDRATLMHLISQQQHITEIRIHATSHPNHPR